MDLPGSLASRAERAQPEPRWVAAQGCRGWHPCLWGSPDPALCAPWEDSGSGLPVGFLRLPGSAQVSGEGLVFRL